MAEDLRLELVLEPGAARPEPPAWAGRVAGSAHRLVITVPSAAAGDAAAWGRDRQRAGVVEEFSLAPATLEDAYIALVGGERLDVRAA